MHIKSIFIIIALFVFSSFSNSHPFYVSIVNLEYKKESNSIEAIFRIFTDDFEKSINENFNTRLNLSTPEQSNSSDSLIKVYIQKHFSIYSRSKKLNYDYIGFQSEFDVTKVYIEYKISEYSPLEIESDLLMLEFPEQSIVVNLEMNEKTRSLILNKNKMRAKFEK